MADKQLIIRILKENPCCDGVLAFEENEIRCENCDLILAEFNERTGEWEIL